MCTVGSLVDPRTGRVITFKQCDLPEPRHFLEPELRNVPGNMPFVAFEREGGHGPWAGVNAHGVAFVAADAYLDPETAADVDPSDDLFEGYAHIVAGCRSAGSAADHMSEFYEARGTPDILVISDPDGAFLIEYSPMHGVRIAHHDEGFVVATNHFRMLPGAIAFEDDHSTYLRLQRAEEILERDPSLRGVHALLADVHFGETEFSICRFAEKPGLYYTQAAVIITLDEGRIDCAYLLNGNPRDATFVPWNDVFGDSSG